MVLVVGPRALLHAAGPARRGTTSNEPAAHGYPLGAAGCHRAASRGQRRARIILAAMSVREAHERDLG